MQSKYPIFAIDLYTDAGFEHNQHSKIATVSSYDELWNAIDVSVKGQKTISKATNINKPTEVIEVPASMTIKLHRHNCISSIDYSQNFDGSFNEVLRIFTEQELAEELLKNINAIV